MVTWRCSIYSQHKVSKGRLECPKMISLKRSAIQLGPPACLYSFCSLHLYLMILALRPSIQKRVAPSLSRMLQLLCQTKNQMQLVTTLHQADLLMLITLTWAQLRSHLMLRKAVKLNRKTSTAKTSVADTRAVRAKMKIQVMHQKASTTTSQKWKTLK